jgi:hypothetical protein
MVIYQKEKRKRKTVHLNKLPEGKSLNALMPIVRHPLDGEKRHSCTVVS